MNLHQKLLEVKKNVPYLQKNDKSFSYTYVNPTAVLGRINPLLNEQGVILTTAIVDCNSQRIEIETKNGIKKEWLYDLSLLFTWINVDDPSDRIEIPFRSSGCNGEEKGLGSALTYAERYFMLKQFNIPTDDDDPDKFDKQHYTPNPAEINDACKKAKEAKDEAALKAIWTSNAKLQAQKPFIDAVAARKRELTENKPAQP